MKEYPAILSWQDGKPVIKRQWSRHGEGRLTMKEIIGCILAVLLGSVSL